MAAITQPAGASLEERAADVAAELLTLRQRRFDREAVAGATGARQPAIVNRGRGRLKPPGPVAGSPWELDPRTRKGLVELP